MSVFSPKNIFEKEIAMENAHQTNYWIWIMDNWTLGRTYTPTAGYFHDKTKTSKENLRVDYYLPLKYCRRQCTLLSPTWAKSLTKFNPKRHDFKRVLDLNCK